MLWRWHSRELGADFQRFYNRPVSEWLRGDMDSAEFLMLAEGLPDVSLFKTWAARGGDWTDDQYVAARAANELMLSRADGKGYMPELIQSPAQLQAEADASVVRDERHRQGMAELTGKTRTRKRVS